MREDRVKKKLLSSLMNGKLTYWGKVKTKLLGDHVAKMISDSQTKLIPAVLFRWERREVGAQGDSIAGNVGAESNQERKIKEGEIGTCL